MAQQGMTIVSLVSGVKKGRKLSDIEFLAIKDYGTDGTDSKRVDANDTLTLAESTLETDLVTQTANTGKDMYLGSASLTLADGGTNSNFQIICRLYVNGTEEERIVLQYDTSTTQRWAWKFKTKGIKVAAAQIIKITAETIITANNNDIDFTGKLVLWEEDTNATPQIPST